MKRTLIAFAAALAVATSAATANALATVTLVPVTPITNLAPGTPFQIDVHLILEGNEFQGGLDLRVVTSDLSVAAWTGANQTVLTSFGGAAVWTELNIICPSPVDARDCVAVNQLNASPLNPFVVDPFNDVVASVFGIAGDPGSSDITVNPVEFFALATAPNSLVVTVAAVPEAGTLMLLGSGLAGLLVAGRRSR